MKPVVLITGASSGIGAALARVFAAYGHELVLVARRQDRLNALADEIAAAGRSRPTVLAADLERRDAASVIAAELSAKGMEPAVVVNNAGFGLSGAAAALSRDEQLAMVDVNVRALTELSLMFVDSLTRHRGGILNVASMAAFRTSQSESTRITLMSLTLVSVGPVRKRSPVLAKNAVASLLSR